MVLHLENHRQLDRKIQGNTEVDCLILMCRSLGLIHLGLRPLTAVRVRAPQPRAYHLSQYRSLITSKFRYACDVEAEPLHRYRSGGYHPVRLGDAFKQGRYKVLHKLGHGGFSTVWIARDQSLNRNVALKIVTSENSSSMNRELCTHRRLLENSVPPTNDHKHILRFLDNFEHPGPNGTHNCLVLELLGPSVATVIEERFASNRLPGSVAKKACKEMALALEVLHAQGIGHGGLWPCFLRGSIRFKVLTCYQICIPGMSHS